MRRKEQVSRLKLVPGIGVDHTGHAADAAHDPEILRMENMDTDVLPSHVAIEATKKGADLDENNSYLPFFGHEALRQAVVERVSRYSGIYYDGTSECIISAGGMSGILISLLALLEVGDEVILTDPVYAGVINRVRIAGGVTQFVSLIPSPQGWRLDLDKLRKTVSNQTKMIVISPGMPSGHILNQAEWEAVAKLCVEADLWLLYDAAMERVIYDKRDILHPLSYPGMRERTIIVGAASKELRMIGWRVGWIMAPQTIMNDIKLVSISNVVCQSGITMAGVTAALKAPSDGLDEALKIWEERRDVLLEELEGLPVIPPHGGWSCLLDAETMGFSAKEVYERLFKEAKVATTPMMGWGETAGKYVRFVFANESKERLVGIGKKVRKALA